MRIVIPARLASSRLPGKLLADVAGKTLLERVYECAIQSSASQVIIAADDERILEVARRFAPDTCLTARTHASGTERIGEVVERLGLADDEIVVNLQGDEPLMPPALLDRVAETLVADPHAVMATAVHALDDYESFVDPAVVKVVRDASGRALYFSRAPVPWPRDHSRADLASGRVALAAWRHVGLYAYRAGFVRRYRDWAPSPLEHIEQLEQLRVLWHGAAIAVCETAEMPLPGVDTPADLERVRNYFASRPPEGKRDGHA